MGVGSICIKDMAGILTPKAAYDLVSAIKDAVDLPVVMHTHCTTGLAFMTYLKSIEAGADVIDTAISPFSGGTSQPATETLYYALKEFGYEVDLDEKSINAMADYFKPVLADFLAKGTLNPISMATDTRCLTYQIPGGMLSNLLSQLKSLNALDKFDEALVETPRVRADMGYPPLVTPTSQLVGTQAVQNVLAGERYKNVGAEIKAYCRGEYGKTPAPINEEVRAKILGDLKPVEGRYADTLPNDAFEKAQEKLGDTARCEEDVLSYISFPQVAEKFFEDRKAREEKIVRYTITEARKDGSCQHFDPERGADRAAGLSGRLSRSGAADDRCDDPGQAYGAEEDGRGSRRTSPGRGSRSCEARRSQGQGHSRRAQALRHRPEGRRHDHGDRRRRHGQAAQRAALPVHP